MRRPIVAGNWKMNNTVDDTRELINSLKGKLAKEEAEVIVAPPFINLTTAIEVAKDSCIEVSAQNMHCNDNGAFTGEVSALGLKNINIEWVILGHSERRSIFGETDDFLARKVKQAIKHGLKIIFCFGEELEDRQNGNHFKVVESQLTNGLFDLNTADWDSIVLAYEPVWAIGTGETASPEQAQEMHSFIRDLLKDKVGEGVAQKTRILYGGSVKPNNAKEIFEKPDVDGGLIGGASLKADDFNQIIKAAQKG